MMTWKIVDRRDRKRASVASWVSEASALQTIQSWKERQARGDRPDISRELLDNLIAVEDSATQIVTETWDSLTIKVDGKTLDFRTLEFADTITHGEFTSGPESAPGQTSGQYQAVGSFTLAGKKGKRGMEKLIQLVQGCDRNPAGRLHEVAKNGKHCLWCQCKLTGRELAGARARRAGARARRAGAAPKAPVDVEAVAEQIRPAARAIVKQGLALFHPGVEPPSKAQAIDVADEPDYGVATVAEHTADGKIKHHVVGVVPGVTPPQRAELVPVPGYDQESDEAEPHPRVPPPRRYPGGGLRLRLRGALGLVSLLMPGMSAAAVFDRRENTRYRLEDSWPLCPKCDTDKVWEEGAELPGATDTDKNWRTDDAKFLVCLGCGWRGTVNPRVLRIAADRVEWIGLLAAEDEMVLTEEQIERMMPIMDWRPFIGGRLLRAINHSVRHDPDKRTKLVDALVNLGMHGGRGLAGL